MCFIMFVEHGPETHADQRDWIPQRKERQDLDVRTVGPSTVGSGVTERHSASLHRPEEGGDPTAKGIVLY